MPLKALPFRLVSFGSHLLPFQLLFVQYDYQEETAEQGEGGEYFEEEQEYTEETETQEYIETEGAAEEQYEGGDETFGEETAAEGEFVEEQTDMDGGELEAEQEGGAEEANGETWEGDEVQGGEDQQQPEEGETGDAEENGETEYAEDPAPADARRIQLVITVEIEEGRADRIEMREGDSPRALAVQFCTEHGLEDSVIEPLTEHILDNIAQLRWVDPFAAVILRVGSLNGLL